MLVPAMPESIKAIVVDCKCNQTAHTILSPLAHQMSASVSQVEDQRVECREAIEKNRMQPTILSKGLCARSVAGSAACHGGVKHIIKRIARWT